MAISRASLQDSPLVIYSAVVKQEKLCSDKNKCSHKNFPCNQCGGNGYMKTSPNCYHTCLDCLGRGMKTN